MVGNVFGLRLAHLADIPFIMATERAPGFDRMVGRWSEAEHQSKLGTTDHAYLLGLNEAGERAAFAIIRDLDDAHGNVCLKRIAVAAPGQGIGRRFLILVIDWVFMETRAYRIWLDVLADNTRARHLYLSHGFVEEGLLRRAYQLPDESRIDLILMALLRPDWALHQDRS